MFFFFLFDFPFEHLHNVTLGYISIPRVLKPDPCSGLKLKIFCASPLQHLNSLLVTLIDVSVHLVINPFLITFT